MSKWFHVPNTASSNVIYLSEKNSVYIKFWASCFLYCFGAHGKKILVDRVFVEILSKTFHTYSYYFSKVLM